MKCKLKTVIHEECCDVSEIIFDRKSGHVPGWVAPLFESGVLRIDHPDTYPTLVMRSELGLSKAAYKAVSSEGYIIRDSTGVVTAMSAEEFDEIYDIIE